MSKNRFISPWWVFAIVIIVGLLVYRYASPTTTKTVALHETDWRQGNSTQVVVLEYSDFQCPTCKVYSPIIKQLHNRFGDEVTFVYRHFPLAGRHKNALMAAYAVEAAGKQGKFWEMHDLLFENQEAWAETAEPTKVFAEYAQELNLDAGKFAVDLVAGETKSRVMTDMASGRVLGITGTPSFFVNGNRISLPGSYEAFEAIIAGVLQ